MLFKCINGVNVPMSDAEEAQMLAEWAANASKPAPEHINPAQKLLAFLEANPDVAAMVCK